MKATLLIASLGLAFAFAAAPASAAQTGYYYWLHPKLGMVKVDRATNAMVRSTRS